MTNLSIRLSGALENANILLDFDDEVRNQLSSDTLSFDAWLGLIEAIQRVEDAADESESAIDALIAASDAAYAQVDAAMMRDRTGTLARIWSDVKARFPADEGFWDDTPDVPDPDDEAVLEAAEVAELEATDEEASFFESEFDAWNDIAANLTAFVAKVDAEYEAYMANGGKPLSDADRAELERIRLECEAAEDLPLNF